MKTLKIDRATWLCGKGEVASGLHKNGKFCCLGFFGLQHCTIGGAPLTPEMMSRLNTPGSVCAQFEKVKGWGPLIKNWQNATGYNTDFALHVMGINDARDLTPESRETQLKEAFESVGYTVEFTGEYPTRD